MEWKKRNSSKNGLSREAHWEYKKRNYWHPGELQKQEAKLSIRKRMIIPQNKPITEFD